MFVKINGLVFGYKRINMVLAYYMKSGKKYAFIYSFSTNCNIYINIGLYFQTNKVGDSLLTELNKHSFVKL